MNSYILVHGAWHGSWCWRKVVPLLRSAGHNIVTPDLPGHGDDKTPINQITTTLYVDSLCKIIAKHDEPIILVGHSMGGMVISQAAERVPDKISKLVYLSGFLLVNGQSIRDIDVDVPDSLVSPNLVLSEDKLSITVPQGILREAFYGGCNNVDIQYALSYIQAQPLLPFLTSINITEQRYGKVPRIYIECMQDKAIPVAGQRKMYGRTKCQKIYSLNSAHSPFFSTSVELADILLQL